MSIPNVNKLLQKLIVGMYTHTYYRIILIPQNMQAYAIECSSSYNEKLWKAWLLLDIEAELKWMVFIIIFSTQA